MARNPGCADPHLCMKEIQTRVAGIHFHKGNVYGLNRGDSLLLAREPNNPQDGNAVRVSMLDGVQVGYVPKEIALSLAHEMDCGMKAYAVVRLTSHGQEPQRPVYARGSDRLRKRGVKASPPECWIVVKIGEADEVTLPTPLPKKEKPAVPIPPPIPPQPAPPIKQPSSRLGSLWKSLWG